MKMLMDTLFKKRHFSWVLKFVETLQKHAHLLWLAEKIENALEDEKSSNDTDESKNYGKY